MVVPIPSRLTLAVISRSDARVVLHNAVGQGVGIPVGAGGVDGGVILERVDLILALNELESEALIRVPSNVA